MKFTENLLKFLPFGYLFLVILGILKESVLYYQIGINILKYSNLMDILISPISDLTASPVILIGFLAFITVLFLVINFFAKNYKKDWVRKVINSKKDFSKLSEEEAKIYFGNLFVLVLAIGLLSFFLGIGIGNGFRISEKISQKKLEFNNTLTFSTNEKEDIYLIGSNSSNYFYVEKDSNCVKISPVGAIKSIEFKNLKK